MTDSKTETMNAELAEFLKGFCRNVPQDPCDTERIALICSRLEQSVPKEVADKLYSAAKFTHGHANAPLQFCEIRLCPAANEKLAEALDAYEATTKATQ